MDPGDKPFFSPSKIKSFSSENECEMKSEDIDETVVPQPLECLHGIQIPPFLSKTFDLVDDSSLDPIISWGAAGVSFVVWDPLEFSRVVLPRNFKHNNFSSFVRQLNTYGFRKVDTDKWEFANEGFLRGKKHLLRSVQRRRSPQAQPIASSIELGKEELQIELENLKKEKSLMMGEVAELQKQQRGNVLLMEAVNEKLGVAEQGQKKMVSFLAKLLQNREFLASLRQNKEQRAITSQRNVKKFLKHQNEPDFENISKTPEFNFNASPIGEISEFLLENKVENMGSRSDFVPCHGDSTLDKGKNVASQQVEDDPKYFVSFPEELGRERNFTEVSPLEIGSVVKQEDLWNLDFKDGTGMPSSGTDLFDSFSNFADVAELEFDGSSLDFWDMGSWPADDYPSNELGGPQNFDDPKTNP